MHITAQGPPVSEMTYTVSSWMLNSTIPYHTAHYVWCARLHSCLVISNLFYNLKRICIFESVCVAARMKGVAMTMNRSIWGVVCVLVWRIFNKRCQIKTHTFYQYFHYYYFHLVFTRPILCTEYSESGLVPHCRSCKEETLEIAAW